MFNAQFPAYTDFSPKVPVVCLTPEIGGCIHRFFDTSPISPSGRYLAVFRMPFEDRLPVPGDTGEIRVIDLQTGENRCVAETQGWEPQMGANINWGGSDDQLFFNDVVPDEWKPFAWQLNPRTGRKERMEGSVYHASPDGQWLISSNLRNTRRTQPGYGVMVPEAAAQRNIGPADNDGFYLTDTQNGRCKLFLSIAEIVDRVGPRALGMSNPEKQEIYGFHSKFSPDGRKMMLSLRWFPARNKPQWDMFKHDHKAVRFAWVTVNLDGTGLCCPVGGDEWEKGGHHATWYPDSRKISMNLAIDRECLRFVRVDADGTGYGKIDDELTGSGHPTVYPGERFMITDSYAKEGVAYGDGTVPLRWIDLQKNTEEHIVRINVGQSLSDISALRIDPHPAWDRTWRFVVFNGFVGGTRRVFAADMQSLVGRNG